jgi:polysaccharide biosynthesis protein PslG
VQSSRDRWYSRRAGRLVGVALSALVFSLLVSASGEFKLRVAPHGEFGIAAGAQLPWMSAKDRGRYLTLVQQLGAGMLRFDIDWSHIQRGGPSRYDWAPQDAVVRGARARGIAILGAIAYTPAWARAAGTTDKYPPTSIADYGRFCGATAGHFVPMGVHAFEVWNEPNTASFFMPVPNVSKYTAMLKACYTAIKAVDRSATVVTGGTAPAGAYDNSGSSSTVNPINWLQGIYANGGGGYFDAVGHHPYSFPYPPSVDAVWSAWRQMAGTVPSLRSVMVAHGDAGKKIWATEWGLPTDGPAGSGFVSESSQASQVLQAYSLWRSYPWAGPLFLYQLRDVGTRTDSIENFFGLTNFNFTSKPAFYAYQEIAANA